MQILSFEILHYNPDTLIFFLFFYESLSVRRELVIDMSHNEKVCPSGLNTTWLVFHT